MNPAELIQKLPEVRAWIDKTLRAYLPAAKVVSAFGFRRLGSYYPSSLLDSTFVCVVDGPVPVPPLTAMGLDGFEEFEHLNAAGITYLSTYFTLESDARRESLHFHELVHVLQWRHLGPERFIMAYALGHVLSGGYLTNPLEVMAYDLEARFNKSSVPVDVPAEVIGKLDRVAADLFDRVGIADLGR